MITSERFKKFKKRRQSKLSRRFGRTRPGWVRYFRFRCYEQVRNVRSHRIHCGRKTDRTGFERPSVIARTEIRFDGRRCRPIAIYFDVQLIYPDFIFRRRTVLGRARLTRKFFFLATHPILNSFLSTRPPTRQTVICFSRLCLRP